MGLFTQIGTCPKCGQAAIKKFFFKTLCSNPLCDNHSIEANELQVQQAQAKVKEEAKIMTSTEHQASPIPPFNTRIIYKNYKNEIKEFYCDTKGGYKTRHHYVVPVAPTGTSIALNLDKIQNIGDLRL